MAWKGHCFSFIIFYSLTRSLLHCIWPVRLLTTLLAKVCNHKSAFVFSPPTWKSVSVFPAQPFCTPWFTYASDLAYGSWSLQFLELPVVSDTFYKQVAVTPWWTAFNSSSIARKQHEVGRTQKLIPLFVECSGGIQFCHQPSIDYPKTEIKLVSAFLKGNCVSKRIIYVSACTWMPVRIMQIILGAAIQLSQFLVCWHLSACFQVKAFKLKL